MLRPTRRSIALAIVCASLSTATAALATAAPATAGTSRGTLSAAEYRQIGQAIVAIGKAYKSPSGGWGAVRAGCRRTGGSTALLRGLRASCLADVAVYQALTQLPDKELTCSKGATVTTPTGTGTTTTSTGTGTGTTTTSTGTTTTGTTTTGTTTTSVEAEVKAELHSLRCLSPLFTRLARDVKAMYHADSAARTVAANRGFTGVCLATLATTAANLHKEHAFTAASARFATDFDVLIRIYEGKDRPTALTHSRLVADGNSFDRTGSAVLKENTPTKIAVCRHL